MRRRNSTRTEAQEQVGFADRILMSKTDLVFAEEARALEPRLRRMNPRAPIAAVHFGQTPIDDLLDIRSFNLNAILEIEPDVDHAHDDDVTSFVFRAQRAFDVERLEDFFEAILRIYGASMMRYKGVIAVEGSERRIVLQGVHMLMGTDTGTLWKDGESRESRIVFIGKQLPKDVILQSSSSASLRKIRRAHRGVGRRSARTEGLD